MRQTLIDIVSVLEAADARPENLIQITWYFTAGAAYRRVASETGIIRD